MNGQDKMVNISDTEPNFESWDVNYYRNGIFHHNGNGSKS